MYTRPDSVESGLFFVTYVEDGSGRVELGIEGRPSETQIVSETFSLVVMTAF